MAWTYMPALWSIGQKLKAATLNVMVNAIAELQTRAATNEATDVTQSADIATLKTAKHFMESARSTNQTGVGFFTTITTTVITDPGGLYNGTVYTVPENGTYMIVSKVRADNFGFGQGVHTSNADGPWFGWGGNTSTTASNRYTNVNVRIMSCTAGDQLRLYAYGDTIFTVQAASLVIYRIGS